MNQRLTDFPEKSTDFADDDVAYIVDVSDTTQDPAGTSFKVKLISLLNWIASKAITFAQKITFTSAPRFDSTTENSYLKVDATKDLTSITSIPKADVGLSNVDNTSDADKPVSTAQQTEIDTKEDAITAGTTSQYWRGDKTFQTLDKSAVGLGNVDNTSDADKPISTATQAALDLKANASDLPVVFKSTTDSSAVTGTTGATKIRGVLIPANTFAVGDIIRVRQRIRKTGANATFTAGIYINTSDAFAGASQLAIYSTTGITNLTLGMKRDFYIKSPTSTEGMWNNQSLASDDIFTVQNVSLTNIDWTVDQYFIFTVNPNSASDSFIQSGYLIERL